MTREGSTQTAAAWRKRLLAAKARQAELRAARDAGKVIDVKLVERDWAAHVIGCRNRLLALPALARQHIPSLTRADVATLDRLVREALERTCQRGRRPEGRGMRLVAALWRFRAYAWLLRRRRRPPADSTWHFLGSTPVRTGALEDIDPRRRPGPPRSRWFARRQK